MDRSKWQKTHSDFNNQKLENGDLVISGGYGQLSPKILINVGPDYSDYVYISEYNCKLYKSNKSEPPRKLNGSMIRNNRLIKIDISGIPKDEQKLYKDLNKNLKAIS